MLFINQAVDSAHFHSPPFKPKHLRGVDEGNPPIILLNEAGSSWLCFLWLKLISLNFLFLKTSKKDILQTIINVQVPESFELKVLRDLL
jgi:hypothetical protein